MKPKINVIIAVYNGEKYLRETLNSLGAQNYPELEIIIVDDGSTDSTAEIAQNYPGTIRYLHQENHGQASAFNLGVRASDADFIGAVDADDLWSLDKLKLQLPPLLAEKKLMMSIGKIRRFWVGSDGEKAYLAPERAMSFLSGLFRRELFDIVGLLDTGLATHNDFDWFMRARESGGPIHLLNDTVGYYRRHGENISTKTESSQADAAMLTMLRRSIARRRAIAMEGENTRPIASLNFDDSEQKQ